MAGLLGGPFCQIAEAALGTVCDRVPLGRAGFNALKGAVKDGINCSPRFSEKEQIQSKYELFGAHIEGACKLLKPVMEIKNIFAESKSADRAKSELYPSAPIHYYSPQNCRCSGEQRGRYYGFSNESNSGFKQDFNNISWKKCDACEALSKFLIPTACDHEICPKCVKSGKDCRKCLNSNIKIKTEK